MHIKGILNFLFSMWTFYWISKTKGNCKYILAWILSLVCKKAPFAFAGLPFPYFLFDEFSIPLWFDEKSTQIVSYWMHLILDISGLSFRAQATMFRRVLKLSGLVFCYQNCSAILWEKIVLKYGFCKKYFDRNEPAYLEKNGGQNVQLVRSSFLPK